MAAWLGTAGQQRKNLLIRSWRPSRIMRPAAVPNRGSVDVEQARLGLYRSASPVPHVAARHRRDVADTREHHCSNKFHPEQGEQAIDTGLTTGGLGIKIRAADRTSG